MNLDKTTGKLSWTPTYEGLYSIAIKVTDRNTNEFTPLDFIIEVGRDYTCIEASTNSINIAPRFWPATPDLVCQDECNDVNGQPRGTACPECPFFSGIKGFVTVAAYDCNTNDNGLSVVTAGQIPAIRFDLKTSAQVVTKTLPEGNNGASWTGQVVWVEYEVSWTPKIDSLSQVLCLQAYDNAAGDPKASYGNYCLNLYLFPAKYFFLSGIVRDFSASDTDFKKAYNPGGYDLNTGFLKETLDLNTYKPVFDSTKYPAGTPDGSVASAASFNKWWQSRPDLYTTHSIVLVQQGGGDNPYTFQEEEFFPIDFRLGGNNMADVDGVPNQHNTLWTYEINTYINMTRGHVYEFEGGDDLWLFIEGEMVPGLNLEGIPGAPPTKTSILNVDHLVQSSGGKYKYDQIYRLEIFFASRTTNRAPHLKLQLPRTTICSALAPGLGIEAYDNANPALNALSYLGYSGPAAPTSGFALGNGEVGSSFGAWIAGSDGNAKLLKVMQGFKATISFRTTSQKSNDGFALVLQSDHPKAGGQPEKRLGYGGTTGFQRALVIEFDMIYNQDMGDPIQASDGTPYEHVSIHMPSGAPYQGRDLAHEDHSIGHSLYDVDSENKPVYGPKLTFDNNTMHTVEVQFTPAKPEDNGPSYGWLFVSVKAPFNIIRPVAEAQISTQVMAEMFGNRNAAYVGLTMGTGTTKAAPIDIEKFEMTLVAVSPESTSIEGALVDMEAGKKVTLPIQTRDACNNDLLVGDDADDFDIAISLADGTPLISGTHYTAVFTSLQNGKYELDLTITKAGQVSMLVTFDDHNGQKVQIKNMPAQFTVAPAVTSPDHSGFKLIGATFANNVYTYPAVLEHTISITAKDRFDNDQTSRTADVFDVVFSPAVTTVSLLRQGSTSPEYHYKWKTNTATSYTVSVYFNGNRINYLDFQSLVSGLREATVVVVAGPWAWPPSEARREGRSNAQAGTEAVFDVVLKDEQNNQIVDGAIVASAILTHVDSQSSVAVAATHTGSYWTMKYTANLIGAYKLQISVNNEKRPGMEFDVNVGVGPLHPPSCQAAESSAATFKSTYNFNAMVGIEVSVFLAAKDALGNFRDDPNIVVDVEGATFLSKRADYRLNGIYELQLVFKDEGTPSLTYKMNGEALGITSTATVAAGGCSSQSSPEKKQLPQLVAGEENTQDLKLVCKDTQGNDGSLGPFGSFTFAFKINSILASGGAATFLSGAGNLESYKYTAEKAGTYTVDVFALDGSIKDSPLSMDVIPAAASPPDSVVQGKNGIGWTIGVTGVTVTVQIEVRDRFGNARTKTQTPNDSAYVTVEGQAGQVAATLNTQTNLFEATFPFPEPRAGTKLAEIKAYVNGQLAATSDATVRSDNTACFATILPITSTKNAGEAITYTVTRVAGKGSNTPFDWEGDASFVYIISGINSDGKRFSGSGTAGSNDVQIPLLEYKGDFDVSVSVFGIQCKEKTSESETLGSLTVNVGKVDPDTSTLTGLPRISASNPVVASDVANDDFKVILRDLFGNIIESGYTLSWKAISDINADEETGDCSSSVTNEWTCSYALTYPAGYWSVTAVARATDGTETVLNVGGLVLLFPGDVSVPDSSVSIPGGSVKAGEKSVGYIELNDKFGNLKTDLVLDATEMAKFRLDGQAVALTQSGLGLSFQYTNTNAAQNVPVQASYNSQSIPVAYVNVTAGDVDDSKTLVDGDATRSNEGNAGEPYVVTLSLFDKYNNPVTLPLSATLSYAGKKSYAEVQVVGDDYRLTIVKDDVIKADTAYEWNFFVSQGGIQIGLAPKAATIIAGAVDVEQTLFPNVIDQGRVAEVLVVPVTLRDAYKNTIVPQASDVSDLEILIYRSYECDDDDDDDEPALPVLAPTADFLDKSATPNGFKVDLKLTPQRVSSSGTDGSYFISVKNSLSTYTICDHQTLNTFTVLPGTVHPPMCVVAMPPDAVAGDIVVVNVVLKDVKGNAINDPNEDLGGNITIHFDGVPQKAQNVAPNGPGNYLITLKPTVAKDPYKVKVMFTNLPDPLEAEKDFSVYPAAAANFALEPPYTAVVGTRKTMNLRTLDAYGNQVPLGFFAYQIEMTHADQAFPYKIQAPNLEIATNDKAHEVSFLSTWDGKMIMGISLTTGNGNETIHFGEETIEISGIVCPSSTPIRCMEEPFDCVDSLSSCPESSAATCASGQKLCFDGKCAATCPCPSGYKKCPGAVNCVSDAETCFAIDNGDECPSYASHKCQVNGFWSGLCRSSAAECPSSVVCPSGYVSCPNGVSCARVFDECPEDDGTCPGGYSRCPDGKCAQRVVDCSSGITCPSGEKLCSNNLCYASSSPCPGDLPCMDPNTGTSLKQCSDGTCVEDLQSCPSATTCFDGYIMCPSGRCALSSQYCGAPVSCPENTYRCSDGSCQKNAFHCGTPTTCSPSFPILCQDGSCKRAVEDCHFPDPCSEGSTCPDGTCVSGTSTCPSTTRCPNDTPIKCADNNCVKTSADCGDTGSLNCPPEAAVRCSDGTCRTSLDNCATPVTCHPQRPIKCIDGSCVTDVDFCVDPASVQCPTPLLRCGSGECVATLGLCNSGITCPPEYNRCDDGTCREDCAALVQVCKAPLFKCPQTGIGATCASSMDQCPSTIVCRSDAPVRCSDGSCRPIASDCPDPPDLGDDDDSNTFPCTDYTFTTLGGCGSTTTCPANTYLCSDNSCRETPDDCPLPPTCPTDAPFYCLSEKLCQSTSELLQGCQPNSGSCSEESPVRCPQGCAATSADCEVVVEDECSGVRCRDGQCVYQVDECVGTRDGCKVEEGFTQCPNGFCAPPLPEGMESTMTYCHNSDGCPYDKPYRCTITGECAKDGKSCGSPDSTLQQICTEQGKILVDGFCVTEVTDVTRNFHPNGCPWENPTRCFDNRCVTSEADCWQALCPISAPTKCDNGFCVSSEKYCPVIPTEYCNGQFNADGSYNGVPCADGTCVRSAEFCTPVRPCENAGYGRCNDGTCARCIEGTDCDCGKGNCMCRITKTCLDLLPYRCPDGLCAKDEDSCRISAGPGQGCPSSTPYACQNGACIAPADGADQDAIQAQCDSQSRQANGCPSTQPIKCADGSCTTDITLCRTLDGCPANQERCPNGVCVNAGLSSTCSSTTCTVKCPDDTCANTAAECRAANGCPVLTPYRCANGECRKYPATSTANEAEKCGSEVVCNAFGEVSCFSGKCAASWDLCPRSAACAVGEFRCKDGQCKANETMCGNVQDACPDSAPIKCPTGECRADNVAKCPGIAIETPIGQNPGGSSNGGGGSGNGPVVTDRGGVDPGCTSEKPAKCYHGGCVAAISECVKFRQEASGGGSTTNPQKLTGCAEGEVVCGDGSCAFKNIDCPIVKGCPVNTYRCQDGSCRDKCSSSNNVKCSSGQLCEDGVCRASGQCLRYDGCPTTAPFHCWNRGCATSASSCPKAGSETHCTTNCHASVKVSKVSLSVNIAADNDPVYIAVNNKNDGILRVAFPSGSIVAAEGAPIVRIRPVADSEMRGADNKVHPSREQEYGTELDYETTVLSTAFSCEVDEGVDLINGGFDIEALIDYNRDPNTQTAFNAPETYKDACLAKLFRIPHLDNYARWQCIHRDRFATQNFPVQEGQPPMRLTGKIPKCARSSHAQQSVSRRLASGEVEREIYAFILTPRPNTASTQVPDQDWLEQHMFLFLVILLSITITVVLSFYCIRRLWRYKGKHEKEKEKVAAMQEEVDDMEQFGGQAGQKDDQVIMSENPLVLQVKDMQRQIDAKSNEVLEQEQAEREQDAHARAAHIDQLKKDRDEMQAKLKEMQRQLKSANDLSNARAQTGRQRVDDAPQGGGNGGGFSAQGGNSGGGGVRPTAAPKTNKFKAKPQQRKKKNF
jgi:fibro-slime domain-containing protein